MMNDMTYSAIILLYIIMINFLGVFWTISKDPFVKWNVTSTVVIFLHHSGGHLTFVDCKKNKINILEHSAGLYSCHTSSLPVESLVIRFSS